MTDNLTSWHEKILEKTVIQTALLSAPEGKEKFSADSHMHSFTKAFGLPEKREAVFCFNKPVNASFFLPEVYLSEEKKSRVFIKLTAMLGEWRKFVCPVGIEINGKVLHSGEVFFENVCRGWPANYFEIPASLLVKGENAVEIKNKSRGTEKENVLYINRIEIIEKPPYPKPERDAPKKTLPAVPPPLYIGGDTDDIRTDESGETELFLELLNETGMGNYITFRPVENRNFFLPAGHGTWKKRIEYCENNGIYFRVTRLPLPGEPFPIEYLKGKKNFQGVHVHESYLLLQTINNPEFYEERKKPSVDRFLNAKDAREAKIYYVDHIKEEIKKYRELGVPIAFGEPSQLSPYLPVEKTDVLQAEPVGNSSFLFGEIRAVAEMKDILWGAHIAIDWYLGFPHDRSASRRFRMMCNLCYTHGASWVYAENSLLKTNAYERLDREDNFCVDNRNILRNFYKYSQIHSRQGKLIKPLAAVYGHLESIVWYPDDRIPELADTNDWDLHFWGKWDFTDNLWSWRALDGWLPPLQIDEHKDNPSILKLFSGTPFGQVDIVPVEAEIEMMKNYRILAFLGWNSMTPELYHKLADYVKSGGILYISGYHLDSRRTPEGEVSIINSGDVGELAGVKLKGEGSKAAEFDFMGDKFRPEDFRLFDVEEVSAESFLRDSKGDSLIFINYLGSGKVYFGNFYDFPAGGDMLRFNKSFMKFLGNEISCSLIEYNEQINYSLREEEKAFRAHFINIDWKSEGNEKEFLLRFGPGKFRFSVREGLIREMLFNAEAGITTESPYAFIKTINAPAPGEYHIEVSGEGSSSFEFFCKAGHVKNISAGGKKLNFSHKHGKDIFEVQITGEETITIRIEE